MEILIYVWIAVVALALVVEFLTNKLIAIWFSVGGLLALIIALIGLEWYIQLPVFAVVTAPLATALRAYVMKKIEQTQETLKVDQNLGKTFMLLSPIKEGDYGTIQINDTVYIVESQDQTEIMAGTIVKIVERKDDRYVVQTAV